VANIYQNNEGPFNLQLTFATVPSNKKEYQQYIGEVNYMDYKKEYIPFDDLFFPFF
jgi:hypothetical protein